ncbi:hypothetical protein [Flavobacterium poyangense]|uniref:hypothetical protein n=1 Tax=Flavobacterium poyangense TaxID=2204302 RepID=UPI001420086F|nr:hypothetical protein [Flavobacterium sp. JXAS1]
MQNIISIIPVAFALVYIIFYMLSGRNSNPTTFRYNELFKNNTLKKHLLIAICFSILGIFRFNVIPLNVMPLEAYYFTPLLFILTIKILNYPFSAFYNRNIIIALRGDRPPKGKNGIKILDRVLGCVIVVISITAPSIITLLLK